MENQQFSKEPCLSELDVNVRHTGRVIFSLGQAVFIELDELPHKKSNNVMAHAKANPNKPFFAAHPEFQQYGPLPGDKLARVSFMIEPDDMHPGRYLAINVADIKPDEAKKAIEVDPSLVDAYAEAVKDPDDEEEDPRQFDEGYSEAEDGEEDESADDRIDAILDHLTEERIAKEAERAREASQDDPIGDGR